MEHQQKISLALQIQQSKIDSLSLSIQEMRGVLSILPSLQISEKDKSIIKNEADFVICRKQMIRYFLQQRKDSIELAYKLCRVQANVFDLSKQQLFSIDQIIPYISINKKSKQLLQRQIAFGLKIKQNKSIREELNQTMTKLQQESVNKIDNEQTSVKQYKLIINDLQIDDSINEISRIKNVSFTNSPVSLINTSTLSILKQINTNNNNQKFMLDQVNFTRNQEEQSIN